MFLALKIAVHTERTHIMYFKHLTVVQVSACHDTHAPSLTLHLLYSAAKSTTCSMSVYSEHTHTRERHACMFGPYLGPFTLEEWERQSGNLLWPHQSCETRWWAHIVKGQTYFGWHTHSWLTLFSFGRCPPPRPRSQVKTSLFTRLNSSSGMPRLDSSTFLCRRFTGMKPICRS